MNLDIPPAPRIFHENGAKHDEQRGAADPLLAMGQLRGPLDQAQIGDDAKTPGLFVPSRKRKPARPQDVIQNTLRNWLLFIFTQAIALPEQVGR